MLYGGKLEASTLTEMFFPVHVHCLLEVLHFSDTPTSPNAVAVNKII